MVGPTLGGEIRSVSPSALVRILRLATGIEMLSTLVRALARIGLGAKRYGEVHLDGAALHIVEKRSLLGRTLAETTTLVPAAHVASISVFDRRAELAQSAGLGALAAGTLIGVGLFTQGLEVAGFAPSLLIVGFLLAAAGGIVDFTLDRLAAHKRVEARSAVRIVPLRGKGFILSGLPAASAEAWLSNVKLLLQARDAP